MNKNTRNISLAVICLAGVISLGYIWSVFGLEPKAQDAPTLSANANGKILLEGKVVPEKIADLGFLLPADLKTINKQVGDQVKAGEVLATQESADLQAQVSSAQANLAGAQAELNKTNHDLKQEKLKVHGLSGYARKEQQAQVSSNEDSVLVQENAVVAAQNSLLSAKVQLAKTILKAPFDGTITRQTGEVGEIGGASAPAFLTIVSSEPLQKIEALASDLDVSKLKISDSAQVIFDVLGTQKTMAAKISAIDPGATDSQGKSTYKVTLRLDETDPVIKTGMHASVVLAQ